MFKVVWLLLLCLSSIAKNVQQPKSMARRYPPATRGRPIRIRFSSAVVPHSSIGTPEVFFDLRLSLQFPVTIVEDIYCARRPEHCPRYCNDPYISIFTQMYCDPLCHDFTINNWALFCASRVNPALNESVYDVGSSSTSDYDGSVFEAQLAGTRRFHGHMVSDTFRFYRWFNMTDMYEWNVGDLEDIRFATGMMMDARQIRFAHGILGLAPGPDNLVEQLAARGRVPRRVAALNEFNRKYMHALRDDYFPYVNELVIGSVDKVRCAGWRFLPAVAKSWQVAVRRIVLGGSFEINGENVMLSSTINEVGLHDTEMQRLLDAKVLFQSKREPTMYLAECGTDLSLNISLTMNGMDLSFESNYLFSGFDEEDLCTTRLTSYSTVRYTDAPVIILGKALLGRHCIAYDFANDMVGLGLMRKPPLLEQDNH